MFSRIADCCCLIFSWVILLYIYILVRSNVSGEYRCRVSDNICQQPGNVRIHDMVTGTVCSGRPKGALGAISTNSGEVNICILPRRDIEHHWTIMCFSQPMWFHRARWSPDTGYARPDKICKVNNTEYRSCLPATGCTNHHRSMDGGQQWERSFRSLSELSGTFA